MLGLAAAPEIATAVAMLIPPLGTAYSSVGTKPLKLRWRFPVPAVHPTWYPQYSGVNAKDAALRSCHAKSCPKVRLIVVQTIGYGPRYPSLRFFAPAEVCVAAVPPAAAVVEELPEPTTPAGS